MAVNLRIKLEQTKGGCFDCQFLSRETESWEMPHICWWECMARPQNMWLKGFPWRKTKCRLKKNAIRRADV